MRYPLVKLLACLWMVAACGEAHDQHHEQPAGKITTKADSLYNEVIGYHDEAMPKIGKLQGYQKTLQQKIDSLDKQLEKQKNAASAAIKKRYEITLRQLQTAEKEMDQWMDSFQPEPAIPSKADLEKYWERQKSSAKKMRDDILQAVDSAKTIIPR